MCVATIWESNLDEVNARHLTKCVASWLFDVPWLTILTAAILSHWGRTVASRDSGPHMAPAITIGMSSFTVMWYIPGVQARPWKHEPVCARVSSTPQLHVPAASDVHVSTTAGETLFGRCIMEIPFHIWKNRVNHSMSDLASGLRQT